MSKKAYVFTLIGSFIFGFLIFYLFFPFFLKYGKVTKVPDLKDQSAENAINILSGLDLKGIIADSVFSDKVKRGKVVSTIPPAGHKIRFGKRVKLILSKGAKRLKLPDVKGKMWTDAKKLLEDAGIINLITINIPVSQEDSENIVVDVSPSDSGEIEKGERVTVYIGKYSKNVFLMSNLVGLPLKTALNIIKKQKLTLGEVRLTAGKDSIIIVQNPLPGVEVSEGDTVILFVGKGEK